MVKMVIFIGIFDVFVLVLLQILNVFVGMNIPSIQR